MLPIAILFLFSASTFAQTKHPGRGKISSRPPPVFGGMGGTGTGPAPRQVQDILEKLQKSSSGSGNTCPYDQKVMPSGMEYVCEDMSKLSCREGSFNDGTGSARTASETHEYIKQLQDKQAGTYEQALQKFFSTGDSASKTLFHLATKATGMNLEPTCAGDYSSETLDPKSECFKKVSSSLSKAIAKTRIYDPIDPSADQKELQTKYNLKALDELVLNHRLGTAITEADKSSLAAIEQKKAEAKIKPVFDKVLELIKKKVRSWAESANTSPKVIDKMLAKLDLIDYNGIACGSAFGNDVAKTPSSMLEPNAFYLDITKEFRFCNGLLLYGDSEFMLAHVISHEVLHSLDPCTLSQGAEPVLKYKNRNDVLACEKENPFGNVLGCLRSMGSIAALRSEWADPKKKREQNRAKSIEKGKKHADDQDTFDTSTFCPISFGPISVAKDQIGESFADWGAGEIVPEYIESAHPQLSSTQKLLGYSNIFRAVCSFENAAKPDSGMMAGLAGNFDAHPKVPDRINRVLMANPTIRASIGCGSNEDTPEHCAPDQAPKSKRAQELIEAEVDKGTAKPESSFGDLLNQLGIGSSGDGDGSEGLDETGKAAGKPVGSGKKH